MALELSVEADAFLQRTNIQANIILEIDGFESLYGAVKVTRVAKFNDGLKFDDGTLFDGTTDDESTKDFISLTGTTNNITQQLEQDRGGSSSITSFKIRMIDKGGELTNAFAPSVTVPDILGREAVVYWQAQGSKHPEDSARLFVGIISSVFFGAGYVDVRVDHPEQLKRQELLPLTTGSLTSAMTDVQTLCLVDTTAGVVATSGAEGLKGYIRIDDEIMQVLGVDENGFPALSRAQLGTIATPHDIGAEYETIYRLEGDPVELSLRLMLSGGENSYFSEDTATAIGRTDPATSVRGAIFFSEPNIQDRLGLTVGDLVAVISGADGSNLIGNTAIVSFNTGVSGSWVVVDRDFTDEVNINAVCRFTSKYSKLNTGAGLKPYQVDVEQFESLRTTFGAQFFNYDYYIKDTLKLKETIDEKLFYPSGLFSLPRKGRISVGMSAPPIIGPDVQTISASNVKNANSIGIARNINQSFYNSIAWKFEEDTLEEKLLGATVTTSEDSFNRVQNIGLRTLTIEAGGIRDTSENRNKIDAISFRFLDRYQFGAEVLKVQVDFKTAFKIEVGDTVILDGQSLNLSDSNTASREFLPRVMECTNRAVNLKTGACSLELTDTNLGTRARYGTFSPASLVGTGSTLSEIEIKRSFSTLETELERDKWRDYVTQKITIRSPDHSTIYTTTLIGLSTTNPNILLVNPPLGGPPSEDWIVESPIYDDSTKQAMQYWKSLHCYFTPQVDVVSATTTEITVDSGDIGKFYVGAPVRIHLEDYSEDDTTTVAEINANTITLTKTLSFTPDSTYKIDLIGFQDEGAPYAFY